MWFTHRPRFWQPQVFLSLDKSPLLFSPVVMRGVLARPDEIAEQIASNYAVDALFRSLAVVGSLEALGSPTTLISEWGKGVYDLFAMPINAIPQVQYDPRLSRQRHRPINTYS